MNTTLMYIILIFSDLISIAFIFNPNSVLLLLSEIITIRPNATTNKTKTKI